MTNAIGNSEPLSAPFVPVTPVGGVSETKDPIGTTPLDFASPPPGQRPRVGPATLALPTFARRAERKEGGHAAQHEQEVGFSATGSQSVTQTSARDGSGGEQSDDNQRALRFQATLSYESAEIAFAKACGSEVTDRNETTRLGVSVILSAIECIDLRAKKPSEFSAVVASINRKLDEAGVDFPAGSESLAALVQAASLARKNIPGWGSGLSALLLPALMQAKRSRPELSRPMPLKTVSPGDYGMFFSSRRLAA